MFEIKRCNIYTVANVTSGGCMGVDVVVHGRDMTIKYDRDADYVRKAGVGGFGCELYVYVRTCDGCG